MFIEYVAKAFELFLHWYPFLASMVFIGLVIECVDLVGNREPDRQKPPE